MNEWENTNSLFSLLFVILFLLFVFVIIVHSIYSPALSFVSADVLLLCWWCASLFILFVVLLWTDQENEVRAPASRDRCGAMAPFFCFYLFVWEGMLWGDFALRVKWSREIEVLASRVFRKLGRDSSSWRRHIGLDFLQQKEFLLKQRLEGRGEPHKSIYILAIDFEWKMKINNG